jgi:hypothetical protein
MFGHGKCKLITIDWPSKEMNFLVLILINTSKYMKMEYFLPEGIIMLQNNDYYQIRPQGRIH